jgi:hypothetical protein
MFWDFNTSNLLIKTLRKVGVFGHVDIDSYFLKSENFWLPIILTLKKLNWFQKYYSHVNLVGPKTPNT